MGAEQARTMSNVERNTKAERHKESSAVATESKGKCMHGELRRRGAAPCRLLFYLGV